MSIWPGNNPQLIKYRLSVYYYIDKHKSKRAHEKICFTLVTECSNSTTEPLMMLRVYVSNFTVSLGNDISCFSVTHNCYPFHMTFLKTKEEVLQRQTHASCFVSDSTMQMTVLPI